MRGAEKGLPHFVPNKALTRNRTHTTGIICWCVLLLLTKILVSSAAMRVFSEKEEEGA